MSDLATSIFYRDCEDANSSTNFVKSVGNALRLKIHAARTPNAPLEWRVNCPKWRLRCGQFTLRQTVRLMGLKQRQGARRGWLVKLMLRTLSKTAKRDRLHILFLVDNYSYLRNFDNSIRRLLRSSHKVTIAYPKSRAGSIAKTRERRMFRNGDCSIAFVPRCNFNSLGNAVRRARNYLLYR